MAIYYWVKHPAENIIRNLEIDILKVIFSGIRKLPRHWGTVEPRHEKVGNHTEVSPVGAPVFILKFCVDSKHQLKAKDRAYGIIILLDKFWSSGSNKKGKPSSASP